MNTSYPITSYTSKTSSTTPTTNSYGSSSPAAASTYAGAADRNSVLPVALVQLMAAVVAMTML